MNKNLISLAVAGVVALSASAASAEDAYQGSWYVLPGVSYMHTDGDLDAKDGPGVFLRLGKELSEHWDVQLGLSHARADEDLNVAGGGGRFKQTLLGVDALYMFSRDRFRPFVLAGLGLAYNDIDYHVAGVNIGDSKTSWMANVGLGAQFMATESLGLQADLRHVWSRADAKANATAVGGMNFNDTETVGNTYFNLGAIWKFGAPKPVAAAEPEPMPTPEPVAAPEPMPEPVVAAPAPMPEPTPAAPATFEKITLASEVLFDFDKDNVKKTGKRILDADVVGKMKAHPEVELVLISGHSDRIGSAGYNLNLSKRRANNVKKYLISQGIEKSRLHTIGKGETEPVVDCKGVRGRKAIDCLQPNRRVVVEIEEQRAGT